MFTPTDEAKAVFSIPILVALFYAIGKVIDSMLGCILLIALHILLFVARRRQQASWQMYDGTIVTITYDSKGCVMVTFFPVDGRLPAHTLLVLNEDEKKMW